MTTHDLSQLSQAYQDIQQQGLSLDLTRGKPSAEQVSLSDALDGILEGNYQSAAGTDVRNYGILEGLPEARQLGAEILEMSADEIIVGGNSSLNLMQQYLMFAMFLGPQGADTAWHSTSPKFLCPAPGYDRHFTLCESLGIEMIPVSMTDHGPNMDEVEKHLRQDPSIRGIWCVPKYANPTGCVYSDDTVERLANLTQASPHFRILWDNAYAVHDLTDQPPVLKNLMECCRNNGTEDHVIAFASTSKVTFAGSGISFIGMSKNNLSFFKKHLATMTIGSDKVNQLRHVRLLKDQVSTHMAKHRALVAPKFEMVLRVLKEDLGGQDFGSWTQPEGGYFISFDTKPGLAKKVVQLAADAGVKLTPAGATFPYGKDPKDQNIRLAPTFPSLEELEQAMKVFTLCVRLATLS